MDEARFDGLLRTLGKSLTRRGACAALGGLGLAVMPTLTGSKMKKRKRKSSRNQVSAASVPGGGLVLEGSSDAERISLNAFSTDPVLAPLWDHTDLTVAVKAGNAEPEQVAAIHHGIAVWSDVLNRHFGGVVTLTDITSDGHAAKSADMHVILTHKQSTSWSGVAICGDDACDRLYVKSDFPPGQTKKFLVPEHITPELVGQLTIHEIGHALGLGHAEDLSTTNDIMGWAFNPFHFGPNGPTPVLSTCDLKALDAIWAWAVEGTEPRRPSISEVVC